MKGFLAYLSNSTDLRNFLDLVFVIVVAVIIYKFVWKKIK